MGNRLVPIVLVALLAIIQAQLWLGKGGVPNVAELERALLAQKAQNEEAHRKIDQLSAEVSDLKEGLNMVEERARHELGMVKPNEIYVQIAK
jgi:cell division protein FtsB